MKFNPNEALETEEPLDLHSNVKILTQILEKLSKKCLIIPTGSRDRKEIENVNDFTKASGASENCAIN